MKTIGKIKDAHGIKGELKVLIFSQDYSWLDDLEEFTLVSPQGKTLVFPLGNARVGNEFLILSSENIKDRTQAETYKGWGFAVDDEFFISEPGETIYLSEIQDFIVKDLEGNTLGQIVGFSSNTVQDLLRVQQGEYVFEVPFVEAFLKKIDFEGRAVIMDLPPGLFDPELVGAKKS